MPKLLGCLPTLTCATICDSSPTPVHAYEVHSTPHRRSITHAILSMFVIPSDIDSLGEYPLTSSKPRQATTVRFLALPRIPEGYALLKQWRGSM